jgi:hypothetical protein
MPIKASCSNCDRIYNLADAMAGKTLKCKECGEPLVVPGGAVAGRGVRPDRSAEPARPTRTGSGRSHADVPDEEDRPARRRRKNRRQGSGMVWWLVGGVAALLLLMVVGGGVVALIMFWPTKATPENFARVRAGMTEAQVIDIMGSPSEHLSLNNGFAQLAGLNMPNVKGMVWRGRRGDEFVVQFIDGKVIAAIGTTRGKGTVQVFGNTGDPFGGLGDLNNIKPPANISNPPVNNDPNGLNFDDFSRGRVGMSEAEVIGIVGLPADRSTNTITNPAQPALRIVVSNLIWKGKNSDRFTAQLTDGKVTSGAGTVGARSITWTTGVPLIR